MGRSLVTRRMGNVIDGICNLGRQSASLSAEDDEVSCNSALRGVYTYTKGDIGITSLLSAILEVTRACTIVWKNRFMHSLFRRNAPHSGKMDSLR